MLKTESSTAGVDSRRESPATQIKPHTISNANELNTHPHRPHRSPPLPRDPLRMLRLPLRVRRRQKLRDRDVDPLAPSEPVQLRDHGEQRRGEGEVVADVGPVGGWAV